MYQNYNILYIRIKDERDHKIGIILDSLKRLYVYLENSPQCRYLPLDVCPIDSCCDYHCKMCILKAQFRDIIKSAHEQCRQLCDADMINPPIDAHIT